MNSESLAYTWSDLANSWLLTPTEHWSVRGSSTGVLLGDRLPRAERTARWELCTPIQGFGFWGGRCSPPLTLSPFQRGSARALPQSISQPYPCARVLPAHRLSWGGGVATCSGGIINFSCYWLMKSIKCCKLPHFKLFLWCYNISLLSTGTFFFQNKLGSAARTPYCCANSLTSVYLLSPVLAWRRVGTEG